MAASRTSSTRTIVFSVVVGLVVAVGIGAIAAVFNDGPSTLTWVVFAIAAFPATWGLTIVLLARNAPPRYHEETIEHQWMTRAFSGTFLDIVTGLGLLLAVVSIFGLEVDTTLTLLVLLLLPMADAAIRYSVLRRH